MDQLRSCIRDVPDFPKPGILFKDITPLLQNAAAFRSAILELKKRLQKFPITHLAAIESRGFIFGSALAMEMGIGMAIIRKSGKLPFRTTKVEYTLEYGIDTLEMHVDALSKGDHVVIVDDVLATGGTAKATAQLVESVGAKVEALAFLSELPFLKGREKLSSYNVISLLSL